MKLPKLLQVNQDEKVPFNFSTIDHATVLGGDFLHTFYAFESTAAETRGAQISNLYWLEQEQSRPRAQSRWKFGGVTI